MRWLETEAANRGLTGVGVGVRKQLPGNRRFYEALGYGLVADHGFWYEFVRSVTGPSADTP